MLELMTNNEILTEISNQIKKLRLSIDLTQKELANKAGISERSYQNIESGKDFNLSSFIKVLRVLGKFKVFEEFLNDEQFSPKNAILNPNRDKPRQRARSNKTANTSPRTKMNTEESPSDFLNKFLKNMKEQ